MLEFLLGIIFIGFCYPALELILTYLQQIFEYCCTKIAVKTYLEKQKIPNQQQKQQELKPAIGFKLPSQEDYYQDQEEQDD